MTVHRKDGSARVYVMNVMTSGNDRAFAEIVEPPRERGRQMLKLGEVVWSYLPSVKKSIRVAGRARFMGGDFENNDILRLNLVEDYRPAIVAETSGQYVLELEGRNLSLTYAKIRVWVEKGTFQPVRQEYYAVNGELVKSASYGDVRSFGGLRRPAVMEMHSALSPKKRTVLELIDFRKGVKNPDSIFRRSNLGK
jgi:outer membrane lipoprotein-sorting protein